MDKTEYRKKNMQTEELLKFKADDELVCKKSLDITWEYPNGRTEKKHYLVSGQTYEIDWINQTGLSATNMIGSRYMNTLLTFQEYHEICKEFGEDFMLTFHFNSVDMIFEYHSLFYRRDMNNREFLLDYFYVNKKELRKKKLEAIKSKIK